VEGDSLAHFGIERLGGGEVVPGGLVGGEQGFGVAAFAGAGAAEDEGGGNGCGSLRGFGWRSARGAWLEAFFVTLSFLVERAECGRFGRKIFCLKGCESSFSNVLIFNVTRGDVWRIGAG
jgi:hypothetical protein